ncbi:MULTISPECIES: hypothetical protein [Pseudoalteromonas]|nr:MULTISPECIES: hypothetical protein [Pseudoalteromonas]
MRELNVNEIQEVNGAEASKLVIIESRLKKEDLPGFGMPPHLPTLPKAAY